MLYIQARSQEEGFSKLLATLDLNAHASRDPELLIEDQLIFDIDNSRTSAHQTLFDGQNFIIPTPIQKHFDPEILQQVIGHYLRILDNGKEIGWLIDYLRRDQFSKRAIIDFWKREHSDTSRRCPCVIYFMFRVTKNGLNMSVHMRSNDINRKMLLNLHLFGAIQHYVAAALGEKVGKYYHFVDTVIVHDVDREKFNKLQKDVATSEDFFGRG